MGAEERPREDWAGRWLSASQGEGIQEKPALALVTGQVLTKPAAAVGWPEHLDVQVEASWSGG